MKVKKAIVIFLVLTLAVISVFGLVSCNKENKSSMLIKLSDINNLTEIQDEGKGDLVFEWLRAYNNTRPTLIIIHGETTDNSQNKFSMNLSDKEYTKKQESPTAYTIDDTPTIGWKSEGFNRDLSRYWLSIADINVAIFHWEKFADEENPDDILAKIFSLPKMRYKLEEGYETATVPQYSLTEVLAALYLDEMQDKANGNEIRFACNGVGGALGISLSHYLTTAYNNGELDGKYIPNRLALCDPYLSTTNMNLQVKWAKDIDTTKGMLNTADIMLDTITDAGTAVEMIESLEVTDETTRYAYNYEKSQVMEAVYSSVKSKLAYFELREKYSVRFSNSYQKMKRVALDWYLYSIIGSDNTDYGYPNNLENYTSYNNHNWGTNATRPMINDAFRNGKNNSESSGGLNFALSAWTPTTWIRALKGIDFTMKKYSSNTSNNTIHGNAIYSYKKTQLEYFRSETNQVSSLVPLQLTDEARYTLICGYVYKDINNNKFMDDGATQGVSNATLNVSVTMMINNIEEKVDEFTVTSGKDGFYEIKLYDKTRNEEGVYSKEGFRFNENNYNIKITYVPDTNKYYNIPTAVVQSSSVSFYDTVRAHNFSKYETTVKMTRFYANAITIKNCLVAMSE